MHAKIGNKRWSIVFLLALCTIVLYMDRSIMSMAGPSMMEHFNWSATEFGLVSTAFFIGYTITQFPGGLLADKFGGGKVLVVGAIAWSIFVFLTPFGFTLGLMILIRASMGLGEGITMPAIYAIIANWIPKKESGIATGLVLAGIPFGTGITMIIATWIIQTWSWQSLFYIFAFLGPIWCLVWWKFGRDKPEHDSKISKEELEYIYADYNKEETPVEGILLSKREIFSTISVWGCGLAYFCANYLFFLFLTWLPLYFVNGRGIDLSQSAIYSMLPYLVAVFTYPIGGYLADAASNKLGQNIGRKVIPIFGLFIAGILLIIGSKATSIGTAALLISASNGFLCLTMGGFLTIPRVLSQKNVGTISGVVTTLGSVAGILAPFLTGLIIDMSGNYDTALYVGAIIAMVGALLLLFACRVKPIVRNARL